MTIDGFCDHTAVIADEVVHEHYTELLKNADTLLYGRITYQLMEYWRPFVENPSGDKSMDDFAVVMNKTPKIVFSHTLKSVDWKSAKLATRTLEEEVVELKKSNNDDGKNIYVGSPSLILSLTKLNLIDEYQICLHPVIVGSGLPLFKDINEKIILNLQKTKTLGGAIILYYEPLREKN